MIRNANIEGVNILSTRETLKATLFADDTTVYLSSNDDFSSLQHILDIWTWKDYPRGVHVACDGEPVRILGAWIGNNVEEGGVWLLTVEKITSACMSQFLTDVQHMPKLIQDQLDKLTRSYLWNGKHSPPVKMAQLQLPVDRGGFKILDLEARNDAIDLMWLKEYLTVGNDRPWWAIKGGKSEA
ncbi:hypothetical protein GY45DRAFT_1349801 [Cubamyces sp. BRFM 1775]|nr:hypothetical protein GY45DRAFT_1349801 [Cubamyces sp. BRFM 1775]